MLSKCREIKLHFSATWGGEIGPALLTLTCVCFRDADFKVGNSRVWTQLTFEFYVSAGALCADMKSCR